MKRIFRNKTFITILGTIICFLIVTAMLYVISQCISGNITISIGVN